MKKKARGERRMEVDFCINIEKINLVCEVFVNLKRRSLERL
jgi:hypothetical protein